MRGVKYIRTIVVVMALLWMPALRAQQTALEPSFENPYRLNAAFPAWRSRDRLVLNDRYNLGTRTMQASASYTRYWKDLSGTIGGLAEYSRNDSTHTYISGISLHYAYRAVLSRRSRNYLCLSAGAGIGAYRFQPQAGKAVYSPDLSPGVVIYDKRLYGSIGINHILLDKSMPETAMRMYTPRTLTLLAGRMLCLDWWKRDPQALLFPNAEYQSTSYSHSITAGTCFSYNDIMPGLFYTYSSTLGSLIRASLGLRKEGWRLHLVVSGPPAHSLSWQQLSAEVSIAYVPPHYIKSHKFWDDRLYCPGTW